MTVKHTDPEMVTAVRITDPPRSTLGADGYGTTGSQYMLRYGTRWHRVYVSVFGNGGVEFIRKGGQNLYLDIDTEYALESLGH